MLTHRSSVLIGMVLGSWLAGTLFMWAVAVQNFRVAERYSAGRPQPAEARLLMRYQASEVNRLFFERWGWAQLGLGAVFAWAAWRSRPLRVAALAMLAILAALQFYVAPETVRLGRLLDFAAREPAPPEAASFWRLHHAYTALDMVKFLLGAYACARLYGAKLERT